MMVLAEGRVFVALDLRRVRGEAPLTCDLYIREKGQYVLYREGSQPFTSKERERLLESGVSSLWVNATTDRDSRSRNQVASLLALPDEEVPHFTKAGILYGSAMGTVRRAIGGSVSREALRGVEHMVDMAVGFLARSQTAFSTLLSVLLHDFSVYTHALNVAVYAVALGDFIGVNDPEALRELGIGAVLHDAGKSKIPTDILGKDGPLSSDEWKILHQHPCWGADLLSGASDLSETVLNVVEQHHERMDGSGYPHGLIGESLHQFSGIVAMADSYDAMTCHRPYRRAFTPYQALSLLKKETVGKLDGGMLNALIRLLGELPKEGRGRSAKALLPAV